MKSFKDIPRENFLQSLVTMSNFNAFSMSYSLCISSVHKEGTYRDDRNKWRYLPSTCKISHTSEHQY